MSKTHGYFHSCAGSMNAGMDLRQLRAVVAVADRRHFTRAAADLHVAQPALSQQVRRLEAELGLELFRRTSRSVALTQAGELIVPRARRILAEVDGIGADLDALRGVLTGQVAIGAMQSLGPFDLPGLMSGFHRAHPGVDLLLREDTTRRMHRMLAADELDLAVATLGDEPPGLEIRLIYEEDLVLAVRPGHPLAARRRVAPGRLPDEPWVFFAPGSGLRALTERALEAAGITPRARFESNELSRVRALVSEGLGVAIMPRSDTEGAGPPVAALGIRPPALRRRVGLVWRAGRRRPPAAEAFLQFALERIPSPAAAART
jgi:LysR family transcriptional regulator, transcription activator of glutamate synthase operon